MRLDFIIIFSWYLQRLFLVYTEILGRAICEEGFEQLTSVISFRVCKGKFRQEI